MVENFTLATVEQKTYGTVILEVGDPYKNHRKVEKSLESFLHIDTNLWMFDNVSDTNHIE